MRRKVGARSTSSRQVTAASSSPAVPTVDGDGDMFAMKVDAEGRELWRQRVGTPEWDEVNHGLVVRPDGRIVLAGYTHRRGEEANDLVAATLSPSGELVRIERFGGVGDDRAILAKAGCRRPHLDRRP